MSTHSPVLEDIEVSTQFGIYLLAATGKNIQGLPVEDQLTAIQQILELFLQYCHHQMQQVGSEDDQKHWNMFVKSNYNQGLFEKYPQLAEFTQSMVPHFVATFQKPDEN